VLIWTAASKPPPHTHTHTHIAGTLDYFREAAVIFSDVNKTKFRRPRPRPLLTIPRPRQRPPEVNKST